MGPVSFEVGDGQVDGVGPPSPGTPPPGRPPPPQFPLRQDLDFHCSCSAEALLLCCYRPCHCAVVTLGLSAGDRSSVEWWS